MTLNQPRYSKEEFARRGTEIYERDIRLKVEADNTGQIVAIDIETGEYAIDTTILAASKSLLTHHADAQIWVERVGHRAVHRIGGQRTKHIAI